jgi:hypothetical protein
MTKQENTENTENTAPTFEDLLAGAGFTIGQERVRDTQFWNRIAREVQTSDNGVVYAIGNAVDDPTLAAIVKAAEQTGATVMHSAESSYSQVWTNVSNKLKTRKVNYSKVALTMTNADGDEVKYGARFTRKNA